MEHDDQSLYAEMRAAIRGDRERAERRAQEKGVDPPSTPQEARPEARPPDPEPTRAGGIRRLFGRRR